MKNQNGLNTMAMYQNEFGDTGYDYRQDDYEQIIFSDEAQNTDELAILFTEDFDEVPFTPAEEEMLPPDLTIES